MEADIVPNDIYMTNVFLTTKVHTDLVEDGGTREFETFQT